MLEVVVVLVVGATVASSLVLPSVSAFVSALLLPLLVSSPVFSSAFGSSVVLSPVVLSPVSPLPESLPLLLSGPPQQTSLMFFIHGS